MPLSNVITKYEKARIIGTRAIQISMNAPPTIDTKGETNSLKIAEMEYEQKKIPFSIIRIISDEANHSAAIDFPKFCESIAQKYVKGIFENYFSLISL